MTGQGVKASPLFCEAEKVETINCFQLFPNCFHFSRCKRVRKMGGKLHMPIRVSSVNVAGRLTGPPSAEILRDLQNALDATAKVIAVDYAATVATWSTKPTPIIERPSDHERLIGIDEQRWLWVNEGTRPHAIRPRRAGGVLRFREGYRAKTSRGSIRSSQGGPSGGVVYAKAVQHPGTQAREFDAAITLKNDALLSVAVDAVLAKV